MAGEVAGHSSVANRLRRLHRDYASGILASIVVCLVLVVGCGGSSEPVGELTVNRTAGMLEAGGEYTVHLIILSVPEGTGFGDWGDAV